MALTFGCAYIKVKDMKRSTAFYTALLEREPQGPCPERWASFPGVPISLYSLEYDLELLRNAPHPEEHFSRAYREHVGRERRDTGGVVFNFSVPDLAVEYERLRALDIGPMSPVYYVNVTFPYWYFTIQDPDGNEIEIEGNYSLPIE